MLLFGKTVFRVIPKISMGPLLIASITKTPKMKPSKQYETSPLSDPTLKGTKSNQPFGDKQKLVSKHVGKEKRPQQVIDIMSKKDLNSTDLQFLAKVVIDQHVVLSNDDRLRVKQELKKLKEIEFYTIKDILSLWQTLGMGPFPSSIKHAFVKHFTRYQFESEIVKHYPSSFLKNISYQLFQTIFSRSQQQSLEVLKYLGTMMSVDQIRKLDTYCNDAIYSMKTDTVVRFLNTFRQLKKRGVFSEQAVDVIIQKKEQISPKYLLMTMICFYELDHSDKVHKLYPSLLKSIKQTAQGIGFDHKQVGVLLQIMHKYKSGQRSLWQVIQQRLDKDNQIAFDQMFAILSGLTRAYQPNQALLMRLLEYQPEMQYASELKDMQFIQFFVVVYFHFSHLNSSQIKKYRTRIVSSLQKVQLKSVYSQIRSFFLYLFAEEKDKQNHLKKAYPNDLMLALLSLAFPIRDAVDMVEQHAYKKQMINRYIPDQEKWENNKEIIVVEEFIRYKLMAAKKDRFKDHLT